MKQQKKTDTAVRTSEKISGRNRILQTSPGISTDNHQDNENKETAIISMTKSAEPEIYRNYFFYSPIPCVILDKKKKIRDTNLAALGLLNLDEKETAGTSFDSYILPEEKDKFTAHISECLASDQKTAAEFTLGLNNNLVQTELQSSRVYGAGEEILIQTFILDIAERKKAEEERVLLSSIVTSTADAIYSTDKKGVIQSWNKAAEKIFGYKSEEVTGANHNKLIPPDLRAASDEIFMQVLSGTRIKQIETVRLKKDGEHISVSLTFSPIKDSSGHVKLISVITRDITKRKKAEEELRESNERFHQLAENIKNVFYLTDPSNEKMIYISPAYEEIWERSCQSLYDNPQSWADSVHPGDRERIAKAFERQQTTYRFDEEYRIITPRGKVKWVYTRSFPIKNKEGRIYRIAGIAEDITYEKKVNEELNESKERLAKIFIEIPSAVIISRVPDGIFIDINSAFEKITGYSRQEVIGKNSRELQLFLDPDERQRIIKKAGYEDPVRDLEVEIKKKNNQVITCLLSATSTHIGGELCLITVMNDITDRRIAQEEITRNRARLGGIVESAMDAIITINSEHQIILFNNAAESMFRCTAEEALGTFINRFIPGYFDEKNNSGIEQDGVSGNISAEITGLRSSGEKFPIQASVSEIELGNEKLITIIMRDITREKFAREQVENSLKEKEVLLKEIHHRVKNNLQIISSLLNLQSHQYSGNLTINDIFKESMGRIKSMALVHEKLYQSGNLSKINFAEYLSDLTSYLFNTYIREKNKIKLNLDIRNIFLEINFAINLGLVVNELLTNSLKHAFPDGMEGGIVEVKLQTTGEKLILTVSDNGVGFPSELDFRKTETLGLQLIGSLVEQNGGTVSLQSKNGTEFTLIFNDYENR